MLMFSLAMAELDWAKSYEDGFKEAAQSGKKVMVMLSKEDCPACWYMENVVFENEDVTEALQRNFVPIHLDIHKDDTKNLTYIGTPTIYFLSVDAKVLERIDGAANRKDFTHSMHEATMK